MTESLTGLMTLCLKKKAKRLSGAARPTAGNDLECRALDRSHVATDWKCGRGHRFLPGGYPAS